jgi:hypothetical protein
VPRSDDAQNADPRRELRARVLHIQQLIRSQHALTAAERAEVAALAASLSSLLGGDDSATRSTRP